jgi:hypothetical protein
MEKEVIAALIGLGGVVVGVLIGLLNPLLQEIFINRRARQEKLVESRRAPFAAWAAAARDVIDKHDSDEPVRTLEIAGLTARLYGSEATIKAIEKFQEHVYVAIRKEREHEHHDDEEWNTWEFDASVICEEVEKAMIADTRGP